MAGDEKMLNGAAQGASAGSVGGPWGMVIGAGLGGLMGKMAADEEEANYRKKTMLAAERDRYSPWTGLKGEYPDTVNKGGITAAGLMSGAAAGQKYGGKLGELFGDDKAAAGGASTPDVDPVAARQRISIEPSVNLFEASDAGLRNGTHQTDSYDSQQQVRLRPDQEEGRLFMPKKDDAEYNFWSLFTPGFGK